MPERKLWELTACGEVPSRTIGRARVYAAAELKVWVSAGCPTEPNAAERVRAGMGGAA